MTCKHFSHNSLISIQEIIDDTKLTPDQQRQLEMIDAMPLTVEKEMVSQSSPASQSSMPASGEVNETSTEVTSCTVVKKRSKKRDLENKVNNLYIPSL